MGRGRTIVIGALALALAGCSSSVPRRAAAPAGGDQGGSWDLVLAASPSPGPEYSRRDAALGWEAEESTLTRSVGTYDPRPSLTRSRRVYVPRDPFGYIYYLEPSPRRY